VTIAGNEGAFLANARGDAEESGVPVERAASPRGRRTVWLIGGLIAALLAIVAAMLILRGDAEDAQPAEPTALVSPDDWPSFGRTPGEQHYSPLDQIDTGNVGELGLAWHYDLEPGYSASTPVAAEGKLFVTSGHSHIRAFDVVTGKVLWEFDGGTRERATMPLQMSWGSKGIAYSEGRIFLGTTDGIVMALDAGTGRKIWQARDYPATEMRNMNGAPRVFGGKVIIGHGGADVSAIQGWVSAYDARTGKLAWRFHTVPGNPAEPATTDVERLMRSTWNGWYEGGERIGGGGTAWNAFSYDPELNLIYLGIGNGYPYAHLKRSPGGGDNLFLASIVAVDAGTGEYRWHYQVCPAEQWDCTATQDMTLATLKTTDGKVRKVLMQAPKNGFFYVLDRKTGELLSAEKYAKVTWAERVDMKTGRPVENPGVRYEKSADMFEIWPGPGGAHNWLPQAYSPRTALVYIPVLDKGALIGSGEGGGDLGLGIGVSLLPEAELEGNNRSTLKAWNPVTQKPEWEVELPGSWPGGVMATAGNLVFQGRMDGRLVALDARSGKELWSYKTIAPVVASPISYRVGGVQYVTVITGNGGNGAGVMSLGNAAYRTDYRLPRQVLTFRIGGTDAIPPYDYPVRKPPADPDFAMDVGRIQTGALLYGTTGCIACHGYNAVGGGAAPDLRFSPLITDEAAFHEVVAKGALKPNGMPGYPKLSVQQLGDIRLYLRARARQAPAEADRAALQAKRRQAAAGTANRAIAGTWRLVIDSPIGKTPATADLKVNGNKITGTVTAEQGGMDVVGSIANGRARFAGVTYVPFKITIEYDLAINGDTLSGDSKNGPFGTFPVEGKRLKKGGRT